MVEITSHPQHVWAESFQHEALFYAGLDDFLAATVPFIAEGLGNDEAVLVAVPRERLRALEAELDGDAGRVHFLDMAEIGRNPAHIIPAWHDFLTAHAGSGRAVRGIGEPIWAGRSDVELIECQRHESLLNVAFADSGSWRLLCPYDTDSLPPSVLEEAERSHPWVTRSDGVRVTSALCRRLEEIGGAFDAPLPTAPPHAETICFGIADTVGVRRLVALAAEDAGLARPQIEDAVLAVHEIATNSIRHAGGNGTLRVWTDDRGLVCEVTDSGRFVDPLLGRLRPDHDLGGRGLWMANQLCDLVQLRTYSHGNVVRLYVNKR